MVDRIEDSAQGEAMAMLEREVKRRHADLMRLAGFTFMTLVMLLAVSIVLGVQTARLELLKEDLAARPAIECVCTLESCVCEVSR